MMTTSALGLGTVQFGLDYGISNAAGKTSLAEVETILNYAASANVTYLDTAAAYGDSERVLGNFTAQTKTAQVITKIGAQPYTNIGPAEIAQLQQEFDQSLQNLQLEKIYAVLVHAANNLHVAGAADFYALLRRFKQQGLVEKIGVSVYSVAEAEQLFSKFEFDVLQIPVNYLDPTTAGHTFLNTLKSRGVEIHARSVFLQGLLVMDLGNLDPYFAPLVAHLNAVFAQTEPRNISKLQLALDYVKTHPAIDVAVVGVNSEAQLRQLNTLWQAPAALTQAEYQKFSFQGDSHYLNPGLWQVNK